MADLSSIMDPIQAAFVAKNTARDEAIARSRELIRRCAESIRAIHRREWDKGDVKLAQIQQGAQEIRQVVADYPDLYYTGYTQDALKEVVEANITYAIIRDQPLPTPEIAPGGERYLSTRHGRSRY